MKKLIFLLLIVAGCSPYHRLDKPVTMRYSVGIYYQDNFEGSILCRNVVFNGDTVVLQQAGYYARPLKQRYTADIRFVGDRDFMVVDLGTDPVGIKNWDRKKVSSGDAVTSRDPENYED